MKKVQITVCTLLISLGFIAHANAADWYGLDGYNDELGTYFDKSSVTKSNGSVTLWVKFVWDKKLNKQNGVYSGASKKTYFCATKKSQTLAWSNYGINNEFLASDTKPDGIEAVTPGTIGEEVLTIVCKPSFPNSPSNENGYYKVTDNDIFSDNQAFFDRKRAAKNDPAPK